ncbi:MAG: arylsulfatase [Phycisphaeraceae bacterium]|nr:arylsulfatase [Phycisphaeraceae bacterium]
MSRPNVLLICAEHWSGRFLGIEGHPCLQTPTLDRIARNGVRFINAYSATPTCIPARRSLMTGMNAQSHGDRIFKEHEPMPKAPTLAGAFADAGYLTSAIGKLHVYPQRDRIGFHAVRLHEEGRRHLGMNGDDYEMFVADAGYAGQEYTHGMSANDYMSRAWHLPERLHPTNWTVETTCRAIRRRDPTRPSFWFMSFSAAHPPFIPPETYLSLYDTDKMDPALIGDWAADPDALPYALRIRRGGWYTQGHHFLRDPHLLAQSRAAYYAMCTHVDHQIRLAIGTLREEGILDDTIVMFVADHGEMLGNHGLFAKDVMYEDSARIPMIIMPTADDDRWSHHRADERLADISDVMPTLLEMAGIPVPDTVDGLSLCGSETRPHLYCEHWEDARASRMIRDDRYKLIYYAIGNRTQLFDLKEDPDELHDLSDTGDQREVLDRMTSLLIDHLYGDDREWIRDGRLEGLEDRPFSPTPDRGLGGQRGWRFV